MEFRKEAVAHSHTQDALDLPVRLTRPRGWIVIGVLVAVMLVGGAWASTAKLPRTVDAVGMLTTEEGSFAIQTVASGQVTDVFVKPGDEVQRDTVVARIDNGTSTTRVRAASAGRLFSVPIRVGQVVVAGSTMAVAEHHDGNAQKDKLVAVIYLPGSTLAAVQPGDTVTLDVAAAPAARFGVLRGRVESVDPLVSTRADVADFIGDEGLAELVTSAGTARRVVVELSTSTTPSGYQWSQKTGPPFRIGSRTGVRATIQLTPTRPIDWMLPQ